MITKPKFSRSQLPLDVTALLLTFTLLASVSLDPLGLFIVAVIVFVPFDNDLVSTTVAGVFTVVVANVWLPLEYVTVLFGAAAVCLLSGIVTFM